MERSSKTLLIIAAFFWLLFFLGLATVLFLVGGFYGGFIILELLFLYYGWMLFAFFHYRGLRQDELLHVLTTAVAAQAPLAPVLRAYLRDRPPGLLRRFWVGLLLFFVLPGYYWIWHRQNSYNRKVARLAFLLEQGMPLAVALETVPGVASHDLQVAAAVGQVTGQMALCLRQSARKGLGLTLLEIVPRLLYPILLLVFVCGLIGFWQVFLWPKMEKIFADFRMRMPEMTAFLPYLWSWIGLCLWGLVIPLGIISFFVLLFSPTVRWYCPGLGWIYRLQVRGRVLSLLGVLLQAGKPVPQALSLLADSPYFTGLPSRRLYQASQAVEQGEALGPSLARAGLLPAAMVPLVQAAERVQNVPWVLAELGENQSQRSLRILLRLSLLVFPVILIAIGLLVGYSVVAMFLPLIEMILKQLS